MGMYWFNVTHTKTQLSILELPQVGIWGVHITDVCIHRTVSNGFRGTVNVLLLLSCSFLYFGRKGRAEAGIEDKGERAINRGEQDRERRERKGRKESRR